MDSRQTQIPTEQYDDRCVLEVILTLNSKLDRVRDRIAQERAIRAAILDAFTMGYDAALDDHVCDQEPEINDDFPMSLEYSGMYGADDFLVEQSAQDEERYEASFYGDD